MVSEPKVKRRANFCGTRRIIGKKEKAPTNKPRDMKRKTKKLFIRDARLAVEKKMFMSGDV